VSWREKSYFLEHRKVIELAVHSRQQAPRVAGVLMNYGGGPLHTAAAEGDGKTLIKLVSEGTDLSSTNNEGATALHIAAYSGAVEGVRALLALGAAVDARDAKKMTPLHQAVRSGARDCVRLLLDAGADVNATYDDHKGSALHDAVCRRQRDLVETLLDSGADPTVRNKWNDTPAATARLDAMSVWDDPAVPGVLRSLADLVEARAKSNQAI
jgi:ankyrin repeat protein